MWRQILWSAALPAVLGALAGGVIMGLGQHNSLFGALIGLGAGLPGAANALAGHPKRSGTDPE